MKISSVAFLLLISGLTGVAQNDEHPDYRTKKESFSKISDKTLKADLGVFSVGGIEESIGKLPLRKISPTGYDQNQMSFKTDDLHVIIKTGPFSENGRKIQRVEEHVVKIGGKPFYGDYGNLPSTEIKSVLVLLNKDTIAIPPAAYADLYNLNFTYKDKAGTERTANGVFYSKDGNRIYIYLLSRDGTGSYEVTWVIQNKQYFRRVVDYGFTK
ncbi:MAG: hypothetical protein H7Y31_09760 [Chitinophagaceae bacterium]|nr:hypothetical protein [Chitinophagaceae bacterium]